MSPFQIRGWGFLHWVLNCLSFFCIFIYLIFFVHLGFVQWVFLIAVLSPGVLNIEVLSSKL